MGANMSSRAAGCFAPNDPARNNAFLSDHQQHHHEGQLGHSFCYVRPDNSCNAFPSASLLPSHEEEITTTAVNDVRPGVIHTISTAADVLCHRGPRYVAVLPETVDQHRQQTDGCHHHSKTSFKTISGASVSANTSTPRTMASLSNNDDNDDGHMPGGGGFDDSRAAAFEATSSFNSLPLQPVPRNSNGVASLYGLSQSGPIPGGHNRATLQPSYNNTPGGSLADDTAFSSGPLERGFQSGPLERGFLSGPLERGCISAPITEARLNSATANLSTSPSALHSASAYLKRRRKSLTHLVKKAFSKTLTFKAPKPNPAARVVHNPTNTTTSSIIKDSEGLAPSESPQLVVDVDDDHYGNLLHLRPGDGDRLSSSSSDRSSSESIFHNLQWAQGKAGEDRVHVVLSEDHGWLFVGIYDGFSGPDAPDFLMSNLYREIYKQLRGLLWDRKEAAHAFSVPGARAGEGFLAEVDSEEERYDEDEDEQGMDMAWKNLEHQQHSVSASSVHDVSPNRDRHYPRNFQLAATDCCRRPDSWENLDTAPVMPMSLECGHGGSAISKHIGSPCFGLHEKTSVCSDEKPCTKKKKKKKKKKTHAGARGKAHLKPDFGNPSRTREKKWFVKNNHNVEEVSDDHAAVLRALENALESTERSYLRMADHSMMEVPELALMGSCVLVMLMKGADVYVMNVGDSRAILAQVMNNNLEKDVQKCQLSSRNTDVLPSTYDSEKISTRDSQLRQEVERIREESSAGFDAFESQHTYPSTRPPPTSMQLSAVQLSTDHSTNSEEEVLRIRAEHPDDSNSILNDRVKGRLRVTRAFGAGFLKTPRWNNILLEVFRVDYVGIDPYVTCKPALHHHSLGPNDRFLVLSSDGLYQYLSNEEVVSLVEWFMENYPDGDPAQYLIEELLFRAAKKAGMDFHELLDIPQGDRRNYHDDVCVMVISLEGRLWRSFG